MCFRRMTGPVLPRIHFTNCAAEIINSRMNRWLRENSVPKKADPDLLRGLHRMMVLGYVRDGLDAGPRTRRRDVRYSVEWDGTASAVATRRRLDMLEGGVESVGGFKVVDAVLSSGCVPDLASLSTVGAFVGFTSGADSGRGQIRVFVWGRGRGQHLPPRLRHFLRLAMRSRLRRPLHLLVGLDSYRFLY